MGIFLREIYDANIRDFVKEGYGARCDKCQNKFKKINIYILYDSINELEEELYNLNWEEIYDWREDCVNLMCPDCFRNFSRQLMNFNLYKITKKI